MERIDIALLRLVLHFYLHEQKQRNTKRRVQSNGLHGRYQWQLRVVLQGNL
jgi:hypothetical protein